MDLTHNCSYKKKKWCRWINLVIYLTYGNQKMFIAILFFILKITNATFDRNTYTKNHDCVEFSLSLVRYLSLSISLYLSYATGEFHPYSYTQTKCANATNGFWICVSTTFVLYMQKRALNVSLLYGHRINCGWSHMNSFWSTWLDTHWKSRSFELNKYYNYIQWRHCDTQTMVLFTIYPTKSHYYICVCPPILIYILSRTYLKHQIVHVFVIQYTTKNIEKSYTKFECIEKERR